MHDLIGDVGSVDVPVGSNVLDVSGVPDGPPAIPAGPDVVGVDSGPAAEGFVPGDAAAVVLGSIASEGAVAGSRTLTISVSQN